MTTQSFSSTFLKVVVVSLLFSSVPVSLVMASSFQCSSNGATFSTLPACQVACGGSCSSFTGGGPGGAPPGGTGDQFPSFTPPPGGKAPITSVPATLGVLVNLIDFAQVAFWILAAGFGLYAAYLYLFSQGSKESVASAKKMMIYTVVAIVLALLSYGIPAIISNFVLISTS